MAMARHRPLALAPSDLGEGEAALVLGRLKEGAIALPPAFLKLVSAAAEALEEGDRISLGRDNDVLTTTEAAEILGMSRQGLVKLLPQGELKYTMSGSHRRFVRRDVEAYLELRLTRRRALDEVTRMAVEAGLDDVPLDLARHSAGQA